MASNSGSNEAATPKWLANLVATIEKSVADLDLSVRSFYKDVASSSTQDYTYPEGISLLTVKNDTMLDYLHHLVALCIWKVSGRSLAPNDDSKTDGAFHLVTNLVKLRLLLEKTRPLESRLKYQMDKLLRAAADADKEIIVGRSGPLGEGSRHDREIDDDEDEEDDLVFRPNPAAFMQDKARPGTSTANRASRGQKGRGDRRSAGQPESESEVDSEGGGKKGIYRPPKLVPTAYDPDAKSSKRDPRGGAKAGLTRSSALLSDLTAGMSSNPYEASSGGVGVGGRLASQNSARAKALARMEEFEEENFTRLVMSKKDANKRRRDEADIALGGAGLSSGRDGRRRIGGGMEEEFGDLLRGSGLDGRKGKKARRAQEAYDTLRTSSNAGSTLQRSKASPGGSSASSFSKAPKSNKFRSQVNRLSRRA